MTCPSEWRGRAGLAPPSVNPGSLVTTTASLSRFPTQRNHEGYGEHHACEPDDEGHERLGREPPVAEGDREPGTGRERQCAVTREATPPDVLRTEGVELRCGHDGGRVELVSYTGRGRRLELDRPGVIGSEK